MFRKLLVTAGVLAAMTAPASAQTFPDRPIRMLVGFAAGGPTDQAARLVGEHMSHNLGQPVIIDNLPGAASGIAIRALLSADADGHTVIMGTTGFPVSEARYTNLEYSVETDFDYIGTVTSYPHLLVVPADSPYQDMREFLEAAGESQHPFTVAAVSHSSELLVIYLGQQADVELEFIPYPGQGAAVTDLLAERLDGAILSPSVSQPFIEAGQLRPLGASSAERFSLMPDVPTFQENGLVGFEALIWNGLLARAGTDPARIQRLNEALNAALADPQVIQRLSVAGLEPMISTPEEFRDSVIEEVNTWKDVVQAAGIPLIEQ